MADADLLRHSEVEEGTIANELEENGFIRLNTGLPSLNNHERTTNNIIQLANHLRDAVRSGWENCHGSRYSNVKVLLTQWAADDLGVSRELDMLRRVFVDFYRFDVSIYMIPNHQPDRALKRQVIEFIDVVDDDQQDILLIFYYAGHAFLNPTRHDSPLWAANRQKDCPSLLSSGIQSLIEEADCDALLLYDTCHSADTAVTNTRHSRGTTELIAACGFEAIAAEVGEHSFTDALLNVLAIASEGPAFSVMELHGQLLARLKGWVSTPMRDQSGNFIRNQYGVLMKEPRRKRTPIYSRLNHHRTQRGIILAPLPKIKGPQGTHVDSGLSSSPNCQELPMEGTEVSFTRSTITTWPEHRTYSSLRLGVSLELIDEVTRGNLNPDTDAWLEWIRSVPKDARGINIDLRTRQGLTDSDSASDSFFDAVECQESHCVKPEPTKPQRIRACFHCWARKTPCSEGSLCGKCDDSRWSLNPRFCTRAQLRDHHKIMFPDFMTSPIQKIVAHQLGGQVGLATPSATKRISEISNKLIQAISLYHDTSSPMINKTLINKAMMLYSVHYFMETESKHSECSASWINQLLTSPALGPLGVNSISSLLERQLKSAMHKLRIETTEEVLDALETELRTKDKRVWATCFCVVVILCVCIEETQIAGVAFPMHTRVHKVKDAPSSEAVLDVCRQLDERLFRHMTELFHAIFKTHRFPSSSNNRVFNPIRDGIEDGVDNDIRCDCLKLVYEVQQIIYDHEDQLRQKAEDPNYGNDGRIDPLKFRERNSGRLVAIFLLSF